MFEVRLFGAIFMFKILGIKSHYNLSDDEMEYQINDRLLFIRFFKTYAYNKGP